MIKKYSVLVFCIVTFYYVKFSHATSNVSVEISEEILFKNFYSNSLLLAKVVNDYESDISHFSEFSDLDDNDLSKTDIYDPFEKLNRKVFSFNLWLDNKVITYIGSVYFYVTPKPIRSGFMNFTNNAREPLNIFNHLLQFKFISFTKNLLRFSINSTLGCFGLVDVASTLNLPYNPNDLGYTLQYYSIGEGFYLFLPLLGPYTFKNVLTTLASGVAYSEVLIHTLSTNYLYLTTIDFSSRAANYLEYRKDFLSLIYSSPDSYSLVKSAYMQNRIFEFNKLKSTW